MGLESSNDLFNINNQIFQTGHIIDSRKNLDLGDNYKLQLPKYFRSIELFRYYKSDGEDKTKDLSNVLRGKIKRNVSQAWIKMYEILAETNLIDPNKKTYKSFHLCEAPGSFIDCLDYYLKKETKVSKLEWNAQSYKASKGKKYLGDDFGIIKNYPNQWHWGADGDGDITSYNNIISYKNSPKKIVDNIDLITSDCGIPMFEEGYIKTVMCSMVAITYFLPINGSMIFKILTPIEKPIIWNIIYLWYNSFKELKFFKPVQNSQSREFYIIGKGLIGIDK